MISTKVFIGFVCVAFSLTLVDVVQGHDWHIAGREVGDDITSLTWLPGSAHCGAISTDGGRRSAFIPRFSQEVDEDVKEGDWEMYGEHSAAHQLQVYGNSNPGITTVPYGCEVETAEALLERPRYQLGSPNTGYDSNNNPVPGGFSEYGRGCAAGILQDKFTIVDTSVPVEERILSGHYTANTEWTFVNQGYNNFYTCTDLSVEAGADALNGGLLGFLAASAWFLIPLALLPVVAAAIYARRHKAESIRLSQAHNARMSAVTAAPASPYKSGFTNMGSGGSRGSAVTAPPASPYKSGFTNARSSGGNRHSAKTAAPATPYKSGLTGVADLDSARTASDAPGYRSGFTGMSDE